MRLSKPVSIVALLLVFIMHSISMQAQDFCKALSEIVALEQQNKGQILSFLSNPLTQDYDLKYHRLEWQVDPTVKYITGVVTS